MAITVGATSNWKNAPAGLWPAVCVDVIERENVETSYGVIRQVELRWQLAELNEDYTDERGNPLPYLVTRRYKASLNRGSSLRRDLESWRNKTFSSSELAGFDVEKLIGKQCQIQVQHVTKGDDTFANVVAVLPPTKGQEPLEVLAYTRVKDREADERGDTRSSEPPF